MENKYTDFESWRDDNYAYTDKTKDDKGRYLNSIIQAQWKAWQASRAALGAE